MVSADKEKATTLIQKLYQEPIREELIARRVQEIKRPVSFAPSARFRRRRSALAPSLRKLAWMSLLSSRPFRPSGTFPPSKEPRYRKILRFDEGAGHCRQHGDFQCHARTHANRGGRCFDRSRPRGGLHVARCRPGRSPGDRNGGLRRRTRLSLQEDRPLRSDHHRWRHEQGR